MRGFRNSSDLKGVGQPKKVASKGRLRGTRGQGKKKTVGKFVKG